VQCLKPKYVTYKQTIILGTVTNKQQIYTQKVKGCLIWIFRCAALTHLVKKMIGQKYIRAVGGKLSNVENFSG
jgi:hypothetical protein